MSDPILPTDSEAELVRKLGTLTLTSEREGDMHVVALAGELDLANAADVAQELARVEATDAEAIVVDLSQLEFIDSTGIRVLLEADARSRSDSCRLTLLRPPDRVLRVFKITGIDSRLPFAD
jgi:anti-anti-sigma factor